jgi:hypothetical protein
MKVPRLIIQLKCLVESSFSVASLQNLQLYLFFKILCMQNWPSGIPVGNLEKRRTDLASCLPLFRNVTNYSSVTSERFCTFRLLIIQLKCLVESSFSVASLQNLQLSFVCSLVCLCGCTLTQRSKSTLTHGRTLVCL